MSKNNELYKILWYYDLLPESGNKIICPFHKDENPSLLINLEEGNWYCFGCQKSGSALDFVKYMNPDLNDVSAYVEMLNILKSDEVKGCPKLNVLSCKKSKRNKNLYDEAYDYYHGLSKIDWNNPEFSEALDVYLYMKNRGFDSNILNLSGAKITYNPVYPIIFPMLDNGIFKGWVCRTNNKDVEKKRKYLYNEGFSRSETLVGDYKEKDFVFVVEGYMDRLKFVQYGITNVVAILGWKMSKEQEQKLKSCGIKRVISALDNDESGRKGTRYLNTIFKTTRFCYLKGIKDPGEMTRKDFKKMLNKTMENFKRGD